MDFYLYSHTRQDTGVIFYIGVGTTHNLNKKRTFKQQYRRAFSKSGRNFLWKRVVGKTKYKIDVIQEFETKEEVLKAETALILKYGRVIDNSGTLTNLVSNDSEIYEKLTMAAKKSSSQRRISTFKYTLDGNYITEYKSITEAARLNNCLPTDISLCIRNKKHSTAGFMWKNFKIDNITSYKKILQANKTEIFQFDLQNNFIKKWNSIPEAAESLGVCTSAIRNVVCKITYSCKGYKWVYDKKDLTPPTTPSLNVYNLNHELIGSYRTFTEAEVALKLYTCCITYHINKKIKHPVYIFEKLK